MKTQTNEGKERTKKPGKRKGKKLGERKRERKRGMKQREYKQFLIILFHQSLPPLEYKRHLNSLTNKGNARLLTYLNYI
jgi:hypothetical protein